MKIQYVIDKVPAENRPAGKTIQIRLLVGGGTIWELSAFTVKAAENALVNALKHGVDVPLGGN